MRTIQAIFEGGVFRPLGDVSLPERTTVEFGPRVLAPEGHAAMLDAFEVLSHSYDTGQSDLAARHDEHQP